MSGKEMSTFDALKETAHDLSMANQTIGDLQSALTIAERERDEARRELDTLRPIVANALCIIQYNKAAMDAQLLKHLAEPIIIRLKDGEMLSDAAIAKIRGAING